MAKSKRSPADLDAELAALEAELAAMEQRKGKTAAKPASRPPPAEPSRAEPSPEVRAEKPTPPPAEAPAPEAGKKPRFGFKLPKRAKHDVEEPPAAPKRPASPPAPSAQLPPAALPREERFDLSLWRREENSWIRTVPGTTPVVRRILDDEGNVVREEAATLADIEEETPVKAERGIGKLFRRRNA